MKVLFAVSNENISDSIIKKYRQMYKEIISSKNVYYFNAILKELQKDKTYDRIVISEDLEPFTNNNYETIDNFIFEKLDSISDEATNSSGDDIPIIVIATDRRTKAENILVKLFGIGVYSTLIGNDRSIDELCRLINKPRTKKEAKIYYGIDSNDVEYKAENEGEVPESEIQNIRTYYKRLGKNEDRYADSFENIASQYTDQQLKIIIKYLPLNVRAVLEVESPRYQQLTSYAGVNKTGVDYQAPQFNNKGKIKNNTNKAISNDGIKVESIKGMNGKKMTKPVIIPSAFSNKPTTKESAKVGTTIEPIVQNKIVEPVVEHIVEPKIENKNQDDILSKLQEIEELEKDELPIIEEPKRGRGRPKKAQPIVTQNDENSVEITPKKGRGRPKKAIEDIQPEQTVNLYELDNEDSQNDTILPGFEDVEENNTLPGFDEEQQYDEENNVLPGFDDDNNVLPGFDDDETEQENQQETMIPEIEEYNNENEQYNNYQNFNQSKELNNYNNFNNDVLESLLTSDKKIVSFVGTSKNGTSFLINNLAQMLSEQGIKTAILDLTKNRNAYYIYTKNEEELRKIAFSCTEKLSNGIASGIFVNKNLDVYTSLPGEDNNIEEYENVLSTLIKNYSLVLLDCDFSTDYAYLKQSQEIYLVQTMDVLTIQPLTAYLRDLKAKGILEQNKLRVVINKYTKVKSVTEKTIIGGMAFYNDPAMSFMTELFNRETVKYCVIPFETQTYSKYLEGLINCDISTNGYSKEIIAALRKLANMVYPLITNTQTYDKAKYSNPKYNKYATNNKFSNDMNSTLDKMKRNY